MISDDKNRINGLVLAGGKSVRMGTDKGLIEWHGRPQRYHMAGVLSTICQQVFISCRPDQVAEMDAGYNILVDAPEFANAGPTSGILTALHQYPGTAWLVVACDLPLLDIDTLTWLMHNRQPDKVATTYKSPYDGLPEPLITIWEPDAYPVLLHKLQEGYKCPRKVLINSDTHIIEPQNPDALINTNTQEDAEKVKAILQRQTI